MTEIYDADNDVDERVINFEKQFSETEDKSGRAPRGYAQERDPTNATYSLYVDNIPKLLEERGLSNVFSIFGDVESSYFNKVRGFAFMDLASYTAAEKAINALNGKSPLFMNVRWKKKENVEDLKEGKKTLKGEVKENEKTQEEGEGEDEKTQEEEVEDLFIGEQQAATPRGKAWIEILRIVRNNEEAAIPSFSLSDAKKVDRNSNPSIGVEEETGISPSDGSDSATNHCNANWDSPGTDDTDSSFTALISHVSFPYVYVIPKKDMPKLLQMKQELKEQHGTLDTLEEYAPMIGEVVAAKFEEDKQWYRCRVDGYNKRTLTYTLCLVDFGNTQTTDVTDIKKIKTGLDVDAMAPLAHKCSLYSESATILPEDTKGVLDDLLYMIVRVTVVKEDADVWQIRMVYENNDINSILLVDTDYRSAVNK